MKNIIVNHQGFTGDLIYCIPLLCEFKEATGCNYVNFHIQTNVISKLMFEHPNGNVKMTNAAAEFIKPLLESINIFDKITYSDNLPKLNDNENILDLSLSYNKSINYMNGNIQEWPYDIMKIHLSQDFSKQRIFITPDFKFKDKVILVKTKRYNNALLDLNQLKNYANRFVFIGLEDEHKEFEQNHFKVDYYQTSLFAIAEMMKVPRVLLTVEWMRINNKLYPGPVNVHPQGGWFEVVQTNEKLKSAAENLLNK